MSRIPVKHQLVYVNSKRRISGTASNFYISLPSIDPQNEHGYNRVAVLDASIPKSYYLNPSNTDFTIDETGESGGTLRNVTLPFGNYSRISLANKLTTLLNTSAPAGVSYTITYSSGNLAAAADTGRYTFVVTGAVSTISFIFSTTNKLNEILGFDSGSTNAFTAGSLTSTNLINLNVETTLFLRSDICDSYEGILQPLYVSDSNYLSSIAFYNHEYKAYSKELKYSQKGNSVYKFNLTDEDGASIDTNGINLVFTLILWYDNGSG